MALCAHFDGQRPTGGSGRALFLQLVGSRICRRAAFVCAESCCCRGNTIVLGHRRRHRRHRRRRRASSQNHIFYRVGKHVKTRAWNFCRGLLQIAATPASTSRAKEEEEGLGALWVCRPLHNRRQIMVPEVSYSLGNKTSWCDISGSYESSEDSRNSSQIHPVFLIFSRIFICLPKCIASVARRRSQKWQQ